MENRTSLGFEQGKGDDADEETHERDAPWGKACGSGNAVGTLERKEVFCEWKDAVCIGVDVAWEGWGCRWECREKDVRWEERIGELVPCS